MSLSTVLPLRTTPHHHQLPNLKQRCFTSLLFLFNLNILFFFTHSWEQTHTPQHTTLHCRNGASRHCCNSCINWISSRTSPSLCLFTLHLWIFLLLLTLEQASIFSSLSWHHQHSIFATDSNAIRACFPLPQTSFSSCGNHHHSS